MVNPGCLGTAIGTCHEFPWRLEPNFDMFRTSPFPRRRWRAVLDYSLEEHLWEPSINLSPSRRRFPAPHQSSRLSAINPRVGFLPAPSINSPRLSALPPSILPSPRHQIEEPLQMPPSRGYPGSPWPRSINIAQEGALSWEIPLPAPTPPRVSTWGIGSLRLCL